MDGSENSTIKFTGIVKYAAAIAQGQIGAEEFLAGIRPIFSELEGVFANLRGDLEAAGQNFEDNEGGEYIKSVLERAESCRSLVAMASDFFEVFAAGEEPEGLRIGMQLLNKGNAAFQKLIETNGSMALDNGLYGSKIAVCSVASEVMEGKLSHSNYSTALQQLKAIFSAQTDEAERLRAEITADCLKLKDAGSEERKLWAAKIFQDLPKLENALGAVTLSVYSPEYVKKTVSGMVVDQEING
ncbi:hypothetical protein IJT93_03660 [bacterium]|nr:hypothetical protein [bacterium]